MRLRWLLVVVALAGPVWSQPDAEAPGLDTPAEAPADGLEPALPSPRAAVMAFLEAANPPQGAGALEGNPAQVRAALATMDLSTLGEVDEVRAHDLIFKLLAIFDRLGEVQPLGLPSAREVRASEATRYIFFPRGEHHWVWMRLAELNAGPPEGRIEVVQTSAGDWRFSAETMAGLDGLYDSLKALPLKYLAPKEDASATGLLGPTFALTTWWGWGSLLACIFVGLALGKVVQSSLRRSGDRMQKRQWLVRSTMLHDAASPASLILLTVGLTIGLRFIHLEDPIREFSDRVLLFLYLIAAGWFLFNLVDLVDLGLRHFAAKTESKLDDMIAPLVRKTLRIFLVIVFGIVVLQNVFELNITGFLASLGIAGLAISLAAQDSVKNLFGSLTIFFDKPFTVGQFITFDGNTGTVEEIGFRSTRLRLLNGHLVTVPNMKFIDNNIENITARPHIRRELNVTITYDTPPEKIEEAVRIIRDILNDPQIVEEGRFEMEKFPPRVGFNDFNADSLNIKVFYWYRMDNNPDRGFFTYMAHAEMVNLRLFRAFGEAGIDFAFPTQTLYLAGDPGRQLTIEAKLTGLPTPPAPRGGGGDAPGDKPRWELASEGAPPAEPRRGEPKRPDTERGEGGRAYT